MTVSEIKGYLQQRGQAPLVDIANHFDAEPDAVLGILEHWQRKGKIARVSIPKCNGCNRCGDAASELYRWLANSSGNFPGSLPAIDLLLIMEK